MEVDCIPFAKTGYFSNLICDYLERQEDLDAFYETFPSLDGFKIAIEAREKEFSPEARAVLCSVLKSQYTKVAPSARTAEHLSLLEAPGTFTVVTGHQLNLFTGPLYFVYKILTTIKLCQALKLRYPANDFIPVYWMATEDHDFEEINHFNFKGKKIRWNRKSSGAVGRLSTEGLDAVYELYCKDLGSGFQATQLKELFRLAYLEHSTLEEATRYLVNTLFRDYGLVVIDGDNARLKARFVPFMQKDLREGCSSREVSNTINRLEELGRNYPIQAHPRDINYFYLTDDQRERIVAENDRFKVMNSPLEFSREELMELVASQPERFSPNVITRPVYQEIVLPNLAYVGGGGELAYWLQLRTTFKAMEVPFPILVLRNSALLISEKQKKKLKAAGLVLKDLFLKQNTLINKKIREISNIDIDFSPQKAQLKAQFENLYLLAEQTDPSFHGAVKAQEVKQTRGLENLEKRLLRAQKRKLKEHVQRITALQNELFPNLELQERVLNFSEHYLELGEGYLPALLESMEPLPFHFLLLGYSPGSGEVRTPQ